MDQQWLDVRLEWEHFNGPVAYQGLGFFALHIIPVGWPIPPGDLIMAYGRFTVKTDPWLPYLHGCTTIRCPNLDPSGDMGYLNVNPITGVWTFCMPPDYPYRFPIGPGSRVNFEITINHSDLEREWRVTLQELVM